ncbi:MAG TPA: hypothetical protein DCS55_00215 [Acidimicrobiaceae bacterium]|nr:hypothetical protein [Acidimicrobiaceae bacterium]|tara:strand:+ start:434 stop:1303 length:870 start_codon:yes stop_codon:yes gene_type:complete
MPDYVPHRVISLKGHAEFSERWLQDTIAGDPTILGLGDLVVRDVERRQPRAGRLDMLLSDPDSATRYEVELQLGPTDETHIIRTIEYWDIERRRYPQYEHVGVIVAEDITSRFLNVIGLFNGFIPLVALQVQALEIGNQITLSFTKIVDVMPLGEDDDDDSVFESTDRSYWLTGRGSELSLALVDQLVQLVQNVEPGLVAKYNKHYVGLARNGVAMNFMTFRPRNKHVIAEFKNPLTEDLTSRIEDLGIELLAKNRWNTYRLVLSPGDVEEHSALLVDLIRLSRDAYGG